MGTTVKTLLGVLASHIRMPGFYSWLCFHTLGREQCRIAQVLGSVSSMWDNWIEFQTPGFILVQLWLFQVFGK